MQRTRRHGIGLALLLIASTAISGCFTRVNQMTRYRQLRKLRVEGTIHWAAAPPPRVTIHADPQPQIHEGNLGGLITTHLPTGTTDPFELSHITAEEEVVTTDTRQPLGGSPRTTTTRKVNRARFRVWVEAPPGWTVVPQEYWVAKETRGCDFTLRPLANP